MDYTHTNEDTNDETLVADYLSGNESAFNMLVSKNLSIVYNLSYYMTGNSHDAEDIVQETFLKVWKYIRKYTQGKVFKTWLLTIARNTTLDFLRKKKHLTFSDFENDDGGNVLVDTLKDTELLPDELFRQMEDIKIVEKVLKYLSISQREVIILRYSSNMTFEDIGLLLGRPLDTVKSQHRRGLLQLKKHIHDV